MSIYEKQEDKLRYIKCRTVCPNCEKQIEIDIGRNKSLRYVAKIKIAE